MRSVRTTVRCLLVAAVLLAMVAGAATVGAQSGVDGSGTGEAITTTANDGVVLYPSSSNVSVEPNTTRSVDITGENLSTGVSAFEITVAIDNGTVGNITGVSVPSDGQDGPLTDVSYAANRTSVTVSAALLDAAYQPAERIELFTVQIEGQSAGTASVEITNIEEISDLNTETYPDPTTGQPTIPADAVYEPGSTAAEFDTDRDGRLSISEVSQAVQAFTNEEITITDMSSVVAAFVDS